MNDVQIDVSFVAIVGFLTEVIMRWLTPDRFDRKRFALPVGTGIAITLSMIEALTRSHMGWYNALIRGILVAMAAGGGYDAVKNYSKKLTRNGGGDVQ